MSLTQFYTVYTANMRKITSRDPSAVLPFASLELRWRLSVRDCSSFPVRTINQPSCLIRTDDSLLEIYASVEGNSNVSSKKH